MKKKKQSKSQTEEQRERLLGFNILSPAVRDSSVSILTLLIWKTLFSLCSYSTVGSRIDCNSHMSNPVHFQRNFQESCNVNECCCTLILQPASLSPSLSLSLSLWFSQVT
ncbi:hypothetical protein NE237_019452 [Protea cynaroides]|uniref:Uncharacterized protein n=1 Tax=Protea cynaroides TaxID=273540 RepID=A0A9Q0QQ06_9MAGN|nr:hypothetical protein NE237_019452 [Protea cynaroides]